MNLDDLKLNEEQRKRLDDFIANQRAEAVKEYVEGAQRFRTWLRQHDQVWVAQRTLTTILAVECVVAFLIWWARA